MSRAQRNKDGTTQLDRHRWSWRKRLWPAYARYLAQSKHPIFVGPWRGEIGFESLYWIPFIDQFIHEYQINPERVIPISRGGAAAWYGTPSGFELYDMRTPQQVRVQNRVDVQKTGMMKQISVGDFDRSVVTDAAETLGFSKYHVIHPVWMYHRLAEFWTGHAGPEWIGPQVRYRLLTPPPIPESLSLPEHFIAVKFYSRLTFPGQHKVIHKFLHAVMEQMTSLSDVVLLDPPQFVDDHADLTRQFKGPRVIHLSDICEVTPQNNLMLQSAVLGSAMGFAGTYGGFAQLALRMGKPSISFYLDWGNVTSVAHKNLADMLSLRMGVPAMVVRIGELPILSAVLPETSMPQPVDSPLALQSA